MHDSIFTPRSCNEFISVKCNYRMIGKVKSKIDVLGLQLTKYIVTGTTERSQMAPMPVHASKVSSVFSIISNHFHHTILSTQRIVYNRMDI